MSTPSAHTRAASPAGVQAQTAVLAGALGGAVIDAEILALAHGPVDGVLRLGGGVPIPPTARCSGSR